MESYWEKIYKKIDYKNHKKFFPIIHRIFRPKKHEKLAVLIVNCNKTQLLRRCDVNENNLILNGEGYHIDDPIDKKI